MKSETAPLVANISAAGAGVVAASTPSVFYESPEWIGLVAIGGAVVLALAIINGIFTLKRNLKYKGKDRRKG